MTLAKKNTGSMLNMPPLEQLQNEVMAMYSGAVNSSLQTKRGQRLEAEINTRLHVLTGLTLKTLAVEHGMGTIHKQAASEFSEMESHHEDINQAHKGKEYKDFVKEFNDYNSKVAAIHFEKITEIALHAYAGVLGRPLDPPVEPEVVEVIVEKVVEVPRPSWRERIFG